MKIHKQKLKNISSTVLTRSVQRLVLVTVVDGSSEILARCLGGKDGGGSD